MIIHSRLVHKNLLPNRFFFLACIIANVTKYDGKSTKSSHFVLIFHHQIREKGVKYWRFLHFKLRKVKNKYGRIELDIGRKVLII